MPKIREHLPKLKLILIEEKTAQLIEQLHKGEIDAALLALPIDDKNLQTAHLFDDEFLLATASEHPLAKRKTVNYNDLSNYKLLLLEEGHCLRDQSLEVCHISGLNEDEDMRATGLETLRQMVKAGTGITFMPKIAIQENERDIAYIPFPKPAPARHIGLVWRKTSNRTKVVEILKQLLTT